MPTTQAEKKTKPQGERRKKSPSKPSPAQKQREREIDSAAGKVIRAHRLLAGLTQDELATKVGVKFQQIQKYETGANRVSISRLLLILRELGLSPAEFFKEMGVETAKDVPRDFMPFLDTKHAKLLRAFNEMPPHLEKQIRSLIYASTGKPEMGEL